jgi:hypothetical protein
MGTKTKEACRNLFCVIAIIVLFVLALMTIFPYGPPSAGYNQPTTNPYYLAMPWYESVWRFSLAGVIIGAAISVIFTMLALSEEKRQLRYLQEELRQSLEDRHRVRIIDKRN